jgi:hypothetical protein
MEDEPFNFEAEILKEVQETTENSLLKVLKSVRISPTDEVPPNTPCLSIENNGKSEIIACLGELSLVIGKAKSKKTFLITIALAAAITMILVLNRIKGCLPYEQRNVLYIDTEQGKYYATRALKRVCKLAGIKEPDNIFCYALREFTPSERLELIEAAIENTPNLGFVVIDGIRDLVTSINDEGEATTLICKLMKWSTQKNIHIMMVLHQNKNDGNARGHLGSEATNKSMTVLSVTKDPENDNISFVEAEFCRDKSFEPFAFQIDEFGLPFILEDFAIKGESTEKKPVLNPKRFTIEKHNQLLDLAFTNETELTYANFISNLQAAFTSINLSIGESKTKTFISYYTQNNYINKKTNQKGNKTLYSRVSSEIKES